MIALLIGSILSSTIILFLFRVFGKKELDILQVIIANYFMAGTLGWIFFEVDLDEAKSWLVSALVLGMLFISLFVFMARSTHKFGMGVTSVAVKMSVAIPIVAAFFLYNDSLSFLKVVGILITFVGIYLVTPLERKKSLGGSGIWMLPMLFTGSGLMDTLLKWSEKHYVPDGMEPQFSSTIFGFAGLMGLAYYLISPKSSKFKLNNWLLGLILGVPNFFSIFLLVRLLSFGEMESSWIFPVNNLGVVLVSTAIGWLIYKEHMSRRMKVGFTLCLISMTLLGFSL